MTPQDIGTLDWHKGEGLLPAIVQDADTGRVLMLGYMNREALEKTLAERRVTFFSRSKARLWTKGETSGHTLHLIDVVPDCDKDTLLVLAHPEGPTCHLGTQSCFGSRSDTRATRLAFLARLEDVIADRLSERPEGSYTARLWAEGPTRIAQKVAEEGVEVALSAVADGEDRLISEAADLLFHLALLLKSRNLSLARVVAELEERHRTKGG
ncbi:MAG TPA: bifunctional phosphoribosyl-AMP cyclohydrolase/phosphoribosyl-ATP diphosphatase HisIE [Steroidobacteraceae bacterium]|jgi:phosphoribosyl-ATP pyrophosphohydrolase/phosphoribosyl-AMP cyclohydrolase